MERLIALALYHPFLIRDVQHNYRRNFSKYRWIETSLVLLNVNIPGWFLGFMFQKILIYLG